MQKDEKNGTNLMEFTVLYIIVKNGPADLKSFKHDFFRFTHKSLVHIYEYPWTSIDSRGLQGAAGTGERLLGEPLGQKTFTHSF